MVGHAMDRVGLKDSKNASNCFFFRKSTGPDFNILVLILRINITSKNQFYVIQPGLEPLCRTNECGAFASSSARSCSALERFLRTARPFRFLRGIT